MAACGPSKSVVSVRFRLLAVYKNVNNNKLSDDVIERIEKNGSVNYKTDPWPEMKIEIMAQSQRLETFFSDVLHLVTISGGKMPTVNRYDVKGQAIIKVSKMLSGDKAKEFCKWLANYKTEEPLVGFVGSDIMSIGTALESTRTFVPSYLENDLKYRLGVHEFYLGKIQMRIQFLFNENTNKCARNCETVARMSGLPIRFIKRLVES